MVEYTSGLMLAVILLDTILLLRQGYQIMATVSTINDKINSLQTDVARVAARVADLEANPGGATQAEVDQIDTSLAALQANLAAVK